jgi:hypothetical protein
VRMPRFRIRTLMILVLLVGVGLAAICRPYPVEMFRRGSLTQWHGYVLWSDGSVTKFEVGSWRPPGSSILEEPRSMPDPFPRDLRTHFGGMITCLEWSDGSRGWYLTPFRDAPLSPLSAKID